MTRSGEKDKRKAGTLTRAEPSRLSCTGEEGRKLTEEERKVTVAANVTVAHNLKALLNNTNKFGRAYCHRAQ